MKKVKVFIIAIYILYMCVGGTINAVLNKQSTEKVDARAQPVAHVIVLAGQSNCEGVSSVSELAKHVSQRKYEQYKQGFDNVKIIYNTNSQSSADFVPCRIGLGTSADYFGIELGIAEWLNENNPDEEFFLIKRAHGGTTLCPFWHSPSEMDQGGMYFNALIQTIDKAVVDLSNNGYAVVIEAYCWMQGEQEAGSDISSSKEYYRWLTQTVTYFRERYAEYAPNGIRFVDGAINSYENDYHEVINDTKRIFANSNSLNFYIDVDSLNMTRLLEPTGAADWIHNDSFAELILGRTFGQYAYC